MFVKLGNRLNRVFIGVILLLLVSSCAIHKDFPFICLRWGCFAKQVGLPDGRAVRKQMAINAKVRKKKRESKRRKNAKPEVIAKADKGYSKEESRKEDRPEEESERKDSIKSTYSLKGNENYLILVFMEAHPPGKDSLLIKYPDNGDEISEYEKQRIKSYLQENKLERNDKIVLKEYIEYSQPERIGNNSVKTKLIKFLELLGIDPKSVRFKE